MNSGLAEDLDDLLLSLLVLLVDRLLLFRKALRAALDSRSLLDRGRLMVETDSQSDWCRPLADLSAALAAV